MFTLIRPFAGYLIAFLLLFFLVKPFLQAHSLLKADAFEIQWHFLIASFGLLLFYRTRYTTPFATLLSGLTGKHVRFRDAFTLFHLSNITRYLPGRIWGVVRLIAMSLLFSTQMQSTATDALEKVSGHALLLTLIGMGLLAGCLFLIPKVARHAGQFIKTLTPLLKNTRLWMLTAEMFLAGVAFFLHRRCDEREHFAHNF